LSLIKQTIFYAVFNLIVLMILTSANSGIVSTPIITSDIAGNASVVTVDDVSDITNTEISDSALEEENVPSWFITFYKYVIGLWGLLLIIAWVRGVD